MSAIPPDPQSARPEDPAAPPPRRPNPRLRRIRDYEREAIRNPDPLAANLGGINADLMRVAYRLLRATDAAMARSARPLEDFPSLLPALNVSSQLARQIHRMAELEGRLQDGRLANSPPGSPSPKSPDAAGRSEGAGEDGP